MLDRKIIDIFGLRGKVGEFGLEIEVEGVNLPHGAIPQYWTYHEDGSLRGESAEYVLTQPLSKKKLSDALDYLDNLFKEKKSKFKLSRRTSVHVHLNVQKMRLQEFYNLLTLYAIFEDNMVLYSGPERVGNLFCLRFRDAEYLPLNIANGIRQKTWLQNFVNDNIRYAACNLNAVRNYGSLEFRSFRGSVDISEIKNWVYVIDALKSKAYSYQSPRHIVADYIEMGPERFLRHVMPDEFCEIVTAFPKYDKNMEHGLLYAFEIAQAHEWYDLKAGVPPGDDTRFDDEPEWFRQEFLDYCAREGINPDQVQGLLFAEYRRRVYNYREDQQERERAREQQNIRLHQAINANAPLRYGRGTPMTPVLRDLVNTNIGLGAPVWPGHSPDPRNYGDEEEDPDYRRHLTDWLRTVNDYHAWQMQHGQRLVEFL